MEGKVRICNQVFYADELYHHGIPGMKWGVRRYQNSNGTLTAAGKKRQARDLRDNPLTKEERRNGGRKANASKWVKEDMSNAKKLADSGSNLTNQLKNATNKKTTQKKMDLSKMSDKEMRDKINRAMLENQYNSIFNAPQTSRGKEITNKILDNVGTTLAITSSALGVALAVKELKG